MKFEYEMVYFSLFSKEKNILKNILHLFIGGLLFVSCSKFGTRPSQKEAEEFKKSSQFNVEKNTFQNRRVKIIEQMRKKNFNFGLITKWFSKGIDREPSNKLPEIKPDVSVFLKDDEKLKVIWFGHSTFLLNMNGKMILVDPVFSGAASPFSFMVKRFQKPVLSLEELPDIDYIVISHDHYDHLDMESIQFFLDKKVKFITPLGVGSYLRGWGVSKDLIFEKDWWESVKFEDIEFTATPAQHFSGRDGIHNNVTLWASWVIKSKESSVYFSGDSGYDTHFKEIGDKLGPFDVAFLESGQYNENWGSVHMFPDEAAKAYKELRANKFFPVHWGMFVLSFHTWYDPIQRLEKLAKSENINLVAPKLGEIVYLSNPYKNSYWWREEISEEKNGK